MEEPRQRKFTRLVLCLVDVTSPSSDDSATGSYAGTGERCHGAGPYARASEGRTRTQLHMTMDLGNLKVAKRLLELDVYVHARDDRDQTPYQVVWRSEMAQLFLDHGAERLLGPDK
jgi:hypothetical protein